MHYTISYKVPGALGVIMEINAETTPLYVEAVREALKSGDAQFEQSYKPPFSAEADGAAYDQDADAYYTYLDFIVPAHVEDYAEYAQAHEKFRDYILDALLNDAFDLTILWRREHEAHVVFEHK